MTNSCPGPVKFGREQSRPDTIYHALPAGKAKRVFRVLDHSLIYLLIAGTYTPFTLGALRGAWGWTLFGTVWGLAGRHCA